MSDDTMVDNSQALINGAVSEAGRRLGMLRADITDGVASFSQAAHDAIDDWKGAPSSDFGSTLFKVLVDVAVAAIPGGEEAKVGFEVGKEAFKGFVDAFVDGVNQAGEESAAQRLDDAKTELRRIARDLADTARSAAQAAEEAAEPKLLESARAVLAAQPGLAHLDDTQDNQGMISDDMGIVDPRGSVLALNIETGLRDKFQAEMNKAAASVYFMDMGDDAKRLYHLLANIEPTTPVADYLAAVKADVPWWTKRVDMYHAAFPGDPAEVKCALVLTYLEEYPDGTPDALKEASLM